MRSRILFVALLVIVGAVLPYLLADDIFIAKVKSLLSGQSSSDSTAIASTAQPTKPTTAGKPVASKSFIQKLFSSGETEFGTSAADDYLQANSGSFIDPYSMGSRAGNAIGDPPLDPLQDPMLNPALSSALDPASNLTTAQVARIERSVGRNLKLPSLVGPPNTPLVNLLSFEITPDWINANWSRVTTRLAELDLQGWRVPLAQGTRPEDLAGSLTYYFDRRQQLQRIVLHGYTGKPSELVNLAQQRFGLRRSPSSVGELYTAEIERQTLGALQISFSPVIESTNRNRSTKVLLELNRSGTAYGMSREFQRILQDARGESEYNKEFTDY